MEYKLKHIGIQVLENDISAFYLDILNFKIQQSCILTANEALDIFNINKNVKILFGFIDNIELELFISEFSNIQTFNHICLYSEKANQIAEKAKLKGYKVYIRKKHKLVTYFICDLNNNMFEIKSNLNLIEK